MRKRGALMGGTLGLLVDTGAAGPLTGSALVKSQVRDMERHRGSQTCTKYVDFVGVLREGKLLGSTSRVLDDDPDNPETALTPPLYGLEQMAGTNVWFVSKAGALMCVPEGQAIQCPSGIRRFQCERSPSGHWYLGVWHGDKVRPEEGARVLGMLQGGVSPGEWRGAPGELGVSAYSLAQATHVLSDCAWQSPSLEVCVARPFGSQGPGACGRLAWSSSGSPG